MSCNRWIRTAATSSLIALGALTAGLLPALAQAQEFVSIKGKTVNVREQPNTRSAHSRSCP